MFYQKLRRSGNSYVVTIPKHEVERQQLQEGQLLAIEAHPAEVRLALSPEVRAAYGESWKRNEAGYRYLADR
ncbi:MAG: hypothetical protein M3506_02985 [Chloroflexota bacterium]|nr:hypothetical protein [Chloroflexota bacterium]